MAHEQHHADSAFTPSAPITVDANGTVAAQIPAASAAVVAEREEEMAG